MYAIIYAQHILLRYCFVLTLSKIASFGCSNFRGVFPKIRICDLMATTRPFVTLKTLTRF